MPIHLAGTAAGFGRLSSFVAVALMLGSVVAACGRAGLGGGPDPFRAPPVTEASQAGREGSDSLAADGLVVGLPEREPVAAARVLLMTRDGEEVASATSNDEGRFQIGPVRVQMYTLVVEADGWDRIEDRINFRGLSPANLSVELAPEGDTLASAATLTVGTSYLTDVGFFQRRATQSGFFMTGEQIGERAPSRIQDLFNTAPGFRVQQGVLAGRRGCPPTVYIDGREMGSARFLENFIFWRDIEGLEGYAGQFPPPAFQGHGCGSVVIWSRRGAAR